MTGKAPLQDDKATVFYDGACPLCRREIDFMRRKDVNKRLTFEDVSVDGATLPAGRTRDQALARFHVRGADGTVRDGAAAFASMWNELPALRPLAKLARIPGMVWVLEGLYRLFLPVRPFLQRLARRREKR